MKCSADVMRGPHSRFARDARHEAAPLQRIYRVDGGKAFHHRARYDSVQL